VDDQPQDKPSPAAPHWATDADTRSMRELFLAEWSLNVNGPLQRGTAARGYSVSYGTMGLQAAFVLNGGVLGALPATIGTLTSAPKSLVALAAIPFVLGVFTAAVATLLAYHNYEWHSQNEALDADDNAQRVNAWYGGAAMTNTNTAAKAKYTTWIDRSQIAAVVCALASFLLFTVGVFAFIAIVNQNPMTAAPPAHRPAFSIPTATEVFNLRSRCAQLGDTLLAEQNAGMGPALYADAKSHYDPRTTRCYVEVDVSTANLSDPNFETTQRIYDGQTKENLAWYTTKGPAHRENDKCAEYLDMPIGGTCEQINAKILEIMTDNRQQ
jgi:hypothetical protein